MSLECGFPFVSRSDLNVIESSTKIQFGENYEKNNSFFINIMKNNLKNKTINSIKNDKNETLYNNTDIFNRLYEYFDMIYRYEKMMKTKSKIF